MVSFGSSLTITYNPSLLQTPGAGNIVTQYGDSAIVQYLGSGAWRILSYFPAVGGPVPSGAVMAFYLSSCPSGWSAANGAGSTVNMVGYFIRGLDPSGAIDPIARGLGSYEADAVQEHTHSALGGSFLEAGTGSGPGFGTGSTYAPTSGAGYTGAMATGTSSTETRPKNIALLYCQKN